jgi:prepilin-type N-terminal cleavage/methylation domain-containing protein
MNELAPASHPLPAREPARGAGLVPAIHPYLVREPARAAGFTLVELAVTMAILLIVMLGVLSLFDMASRVSRVQIDVAEMQQAQRAGHYEMARMVRTAARGSLPLQSPGSGGVWEPLMLPNGLALAVTDDVGKNTFIDAPTDKHKILQGTDVLTVRGVFSTPVYTVVEDSFVFNPVSGRGTFQVSSQARPGIPVPQDLDALVEAFDPPDGEPAVQEALILVSAVSDAIYHVVELDPAACSGPDPNPDGGSVVTLAFRSRPADGTRTAAYWNLSGGGWDAQFSDPNTQLAYVGILEEYRYYVRDVREVPSDDKSGVKPVLVRARLFPGTAESDPPMAPAQQVYAGDGENWAMAIADDVADLQVALGVDRDDEPGDTPADPPDIPVAINNPPFYPTEGDHDATTPNPEPDVDEWLFNDPDDDLKDPWTTGRLEVVRISTTSVSARRDRDFQRGRYPDDPVETRLEDHEYEIPDYGAKSPVTPDRTYRRRTMRTVVDLRNL